MSEKTPPFNALGEGSNDNQIRPCPICGKPAIPKYKPFCSKRCADVDLNRWLSEGYRIPTEEPALGNDDDDYGSY